MGAGSLFASTICEREAKLDNSLECIAEESRPTPHVLSQPERAASVPVHADSSENTVHQSSETLDAWLASSQALGWRPTVGNADATRGVVFAATSMPDTAHNASVIRNESPIPRELTKTPSAIRAGIATAPESSRADATASKVLDKYGELPLSFEANEGQTDARVDFVARGAGYTLFLTPTEAVFAIQKSSPTPGGGRPSMFSAQTTETTGGHCICRSSAAIRRPRR